AANADQVIQEQLRWYKEHVNGSGLEWKTYDHDTPPDLPQRLIAHGFAASEREALLVLDLENCPDIYLQPVTADVRQITAAGQFREVADIQTAVYGEDFGWLTKQINENIAAQPDYWRIYAAYVDLSPPAPPGFPFRRKASLPGCGAERR
ncbi:MAG: hypothetical protein IPM57_12665, partial [Oligoflexia bacterium]|nr:hypothetical protein [Oligoflexia bacterium]